MSTLATARTNMIKGQVIPAGITDRRLIAALSAVPREHFVRQRVASLAFYDADILLKEATPISPARYLMAVAPFARLVQDAAIDREAVVLDIGCTTGYSSAVLGRFSSHVFALESDEELSALAISSLTDLNAENITVVTGPLREGWPAGAPYDAVVLEGSVDMVPTMLIDQLKVGGRLVAVIGSGLAGLGTIYTKTAGAFGTRQSFNAAVPRLPGFEAPEVFVF